MIFFEYMRRIYGGYLQKHGADMTNCATSVRLCCINILASAFVLALFSLSILCFVVVVVFVAVVVVVVFVRFLFLLLFICGCDGICVTAGVFICFV